MLITSRRNQSLDVLRAIAVFGVLGDHAPYYALWARAGGYGVDLFFVLSGFLISGLLFEEYKTSGGVRIPRFLIRRGFKSWPSYYLLVIAVGLANLYLANGPGELNGARTQLIASVFIFPNYLSASSYLALVHTWSHLVEIPYLKLREGLRTSELIMSNALLGIWKPGCIYPRHASSN